MPVEYETPMGFCQFQTWIYHLQLWCGANKQDLNMCGCSQKRLRDPVIAADGMTYERSAMEAWLAAQHGPPELLTSPVSGAVLAHTFLLPNLAVRALLEL